MKVLLLVSILLASVACGYAITCTTCTEMTSDDPNFPLPPAEAACSTNPGEMVCDEGCMTMIVTMEFTRDSGPLTMTQTQRSCGPPAAAGFPTGDICADQATVDTATANLPDPATLFPPQLGLTFENLDVSLCTCNSSDKCTPPSPAIGGGTQPVLQTTVTGVPEDFPVTGDWFVDWEASYDCLSEWSSIGPFTNPGQILPMLTVSDVIQATGAAWRAGNLIEAEGEVCVRVLPQITVVAGGPDVFSQYCDPVLSYLREGTTFDAEEHCRLILNLTGAMSTYMPPTYPQELFQNMLNLPQIQSLRPFDLIDHIEKIVYQLLGVSFNNVDNVCAARQTITESESTLEELVTVFLVEFVKVLLPRGAELCNSWSEIINILSVFHTNSFPTFTSFDNTPGQDVDLGDIIQEVSDIVAHLTGYIDREALCQALNNAVTSSVDSSAFDEHDEVVTHIVNSTLSILTNAHQCSTIAQESLNFSLNVLTEHTAGELDAVIYQFTGFKSVQDICQEVSDSFLPRGESTPAPSSVQVRLFGGSDDTEGTVEVFHDGQWGTVCDDSWDLNDANVVCRMLGFYGASGSPGYARFGEGSGPIWLDDVECSGNEMNLADCQHRPFGENNCAHFEDAGVVCIAQGESTPTPLSVEVRLFGGSDDTEGTVEVFHDGQWGTVCDDSWDLNDANVVCRMLGFLGASDSPGYARFGEGSGPIWLDDVACSGNEMNLDDCQHRPFGENNCAHYEDAGVVCIAQAPTIIDVRLVGGERDLEGTIEIQYNGEWGTVCDDSWDLDDAHVVCRMLGFDGASAAPPRARFGEGSGPILLDNVECSGDEDNLADCLHLPFKEHNCGHYEDAGAICFIIGESTPAPPSVEVRLFGGNDDTEGTVEVFHDGQWGTVCDDMWDLNDANVVCRMLGFFGASGSPGYARFGEGSGPIWLDDVVCSGNEMNLADCRHRPFGENDCAHFEDAGVVCISQEPTTPKPPPSCTIIDVRLVGGSSEEEGRVEIQYRGQWGTICDDDWDVDDASVVCRMLGFDAASQAVVSAAFGQGSGPILLDDVMCLGNEDNLFDCGHQPLEQHNCLHSEDAGAVCFNIVSTTRPTAEMPTTQPTTQAPTIITGIRLVGGSSNHEGRVEIRYGGQWGTICDDYWGMSDAEVACRMLGFDGASDAVGSAHFGRGSGPIWLDDMRCEGEEVNLEDCPRRPFGHNNCWHEEDAGVVCYSTLTTAPPPPTTAPSTTTPQLTTPVPTIENIRLVGGSFGNEGRVEILYEGQWGTVCDDLWDLSDASVACRMLGYERASEAASSARFGQGSGPILLDDVMCSGNETNLADCSHPAFRNHNCWHGEDAGVVCFDPDQTTSSEPTTPTPPPRQVRLVGGNIPSMGRVEVTNSYGHWGTICDTYWSQRDANVVCRMLGYDGASSYSNNAEYGQSRGRIELDDVSCSGRESNIASCQLHEYGGWYCDKDREVGVACNVPEPSEFQIRLVNGSHPWEGRVELFYDGEWGTICSYYWGKSDGDVACRMLGYNGAYEAPAPTGVYSFRLFAEGTGSILLSDFRCTGTEENLADCSHSGWGDHNCYHWSDASLICNSPDPDSVVVRLVNGSSKTEGRVEVLYEGEFGTVCDDSWNISDANVICRMLGYEGASEAPGSARFGMGSGDIVIDDVVCLGSEENIASCEHSGWRTHNCDHGEDAGVVCSGELSLPVRLVNGDSDNEGRVEIYRYGAWGSVCDDFWDINDGNVVCRMLGYQRASRIWWGTRYGPGSGWILLDNVECTGTEATLDDCVHPGWGVHDCDHYEDAGVVCA